MMIIKILGFFYVLLDIVRDLFCVVLIDIYVFDKLFLDLDCIFIEF